MEEKRTKQRPGLILAAGAMIQILTGIPAAWGAFQKPLMRDYSFTEVQASLAFHLLIAAFGVGCVVGGFFQDRRGVRQAALWGTAFLCTAFLGAGMLPSERIAAFGILFSIPVGVGCAFLYPSIQSCVQKWYGERRGFATGVIGGAVGLSGGFLTLFVGRFQGGVAGFEGIRGVFWLLGWLMLPVCLGGSFLLKDPPPPKQRSEQQGRRREKELDYSPRQMLVTPQYWLCAAAVCFSTPAVLLFSSIIVRLGTERGLDENTALLAIIFGSIGSAVGRLLMPMLSDKIGRRNADLLLFGVSAVLSAVFAFAKGWLVLAVYAGLTFCYSALGAVLPSFSTDLFGLKHAGVNYGFLAIGQSVGSLGFPVLVQGMGIEGGRHIIAFICAILGFVCIWFVRPTTGSEEKATKPN